MIPISKSIRQQQFLVFVIIVSLLHGKATSTAYIKSGEITQSPFRFENSHQSLPFLKKNNHAAPVVSSMPLYSSKVSWWDRLFVSDDDVNKNKKGGVIQKDSKIPEDYNVIGTVIRTAGRIYNETSCSPSSRSYTTKKDSRPYITISKPDGVVDDYNHYRTQALKSTPDRAVSLLTNDVMDTLRGRKQGSSNTNRRQQGNTIASNYCSLIEDGDLGENILIDNLNYKFFRVGKKYKFLTSINSDEETQSLSSSITDKSLVDLEEYNNDIEHGDEGNLRGCVIIEITEKLIPCANLCKLPFINDEKLSPKERIERCQDFLNLLDSGGDGFRGWYGKVVQGGTIHVGDKVMLC